MNNFNITVQTNISHPNIYFIILYYKFSPTILGKHKEEGTEKVSSFILKNFLKSLLTINKNSDKLYIDRK